MEIGKDSEMHRLHRKEQICLFTLKFVLSKQKFKKKTEKAY